MQLIPQRRETHGPRARARLASSVRVATISTLLCLVAGCPTEGSPDGGPTDAGADVGADACTGTAGVLEGFREVRAGGLLPDLVFDDGTAELHLASFHRPCAPPSLLVIRSLAAWSGPSRWHAAHSAALIAQERVTVLDVWTEDADGLPARAAVLDDLPYDVAPADRAIDPEDQLAPLAMSGIRLPLVAIVDRRTLEVVRVLAAPHATDVEHACLTVLRQMDGLPPPPPRELDLVDGRFTPDGWDLIQGMRWAPPPPDPSNRVADDPVAAGIGATFFEDAGMSPAGVACATCHVPAQAFVDGREVGHGVADVRRNTPTLFGAAHTRWPFWDGRVDSLWAQALGPIESPEEMASSRLYVAHRVVAVHARSYERLFGPLPDLSDASRFPAEGRPGDPAYDGMTADDRATIDTIFANVGKAMAAFERTLTPEATAFDRYLDGDLEAMSPTARDGLVRFLENGCVGCHHGPTLSDDAFHAILMPGHAAPPDDDRGRIAALAALRASPFRRTGAFSDDPLAVDPVADVTELPARTLGAFRTPPLRALAATAPYGHAGTFPTLRDVVSHYAVVRFMERTDPRVVGELDPHVPAFEPVETQVGPLTAFLEAL